MSDAREKSQYEREEDVAAELRMSVLLNKEGILTAPVHTIFINQGRPAVLVGNDDGTFLVTVQKITGAVASQLQKMGGGEGSG